MGLGSVEVEENSTARQPDDEHEGNEWRLPNEEPDGRFLAVLVVFEGHHARDHLGLACDPEPTEEERTYPQRYAKGQVGREQVDHSRVDVLE